MEPYSRRSINTFIKKYNSELMKRRGSKVNRNGVIVGVIGFDELGELYELPSPSSHADLEREVLNNGSKQLLAYGQGFYDTEGFLFLKKSAMDRAARVGQVNREETTNKVYLSVSDVWQKED